MRPWFRIACAAVLLGGLALGAWDTFAERVPAELHRELRALGEAAEAHRRYHAGAWPTGIEVAGSPSAAAGTCLVVSEDAATDPWGRPYRFTRGRFTSLGADGRPGGTGRDADHAWDVVRGACGCGAR